MVMIINPLASQMTHEEYSSCSLCGRSAGVETGYDCLTVWGAGVGRGVGEGSTPVGDCFSTVRFSTISGISWSLPW